MDLSTAYGVLNRSTHKGRPSAGVRAKRVLYVAESSFTTARNVKHVEKIRSMSDPHVAISHRTLKVVYALYRCPNNTATYNGLRRVLGLSSDSGVRSCVRAATAEGFVEILRSGRGRGDKASLRLTTIGAKLIRRLAGER